MKGVQSRAVNERHNRVYPSILRGGAHTRLPVPQGTCAPTRSMDGLPQCAETENTAETSYLRSNFSPILPAKNSRCSSRTLSEGPLSQLTHRGPRALLLGCGESPRRRRTHPRPLWKALAPKHGDADDGRPVALPPPSLLARRVVLARASSAADGALCGGAEIRASPPRPGASSRDGCS